MFNARNFAGTTSCKRGSMVPEPPRTSPQQDQAVTGSPLPPPPPSSQQPQPYIQVSYFCAIFGRRLMLKNSRRLRRGAARYRVNARYRPHVRSRLTFATTIERPKETQRVPTSGPSTLRLRQDHRETSLSSDARSFRAST